MSEEKSGSKVWEKNATSTKLIIIGVLALLLIPATMIRGLIDEREARNTSVTQEIGSKWGLEQPVKKNRHPRVPLAGIQGFKAWIPDEDLGYDGLESRAADKPLTTPAPRPAA